MREDFSLDGYRRLLAAFRGRGYEARGYADARPASKHLILRHDIDMSIELAVALAGVERELGVCATYFALVRSELYNPGSGRGREGLRKLGELGHAVGLHFDAALYPDEEGALEAACADECRALEDCLGRPVEMVSFHRPAESLLGSEARIAGRRHAYEPHFFRDMGYCSDSRGDWHHGHPLEHEAVKQGRALQLLTHPIWWVAEPGETAVGRLERLAREQDQAYRRELAAQCEPFRATLESEGGGG